MGIRVEFNPDLALREHGTAGRDAAECVPARLEPGETHPFLKSGQRNYWLLGEIPLVTTKGNQDLSRPLASVRIREATHLLKDGETWTRGTYEIVAVFDDDAIHFDGFTRI